MTFRKESHRLVAPAAAAAVTAAAFTAVLWVQHSRGAWPFGAAGDAAAASGEVRLEPGLATAPVSTDASAHARVAVDVGEGTRQELGIEVEMVTRRSLTQAVRSVATVVPDESRLSHVHTRVAGWVEDLDVNTTGEVVKAGQPLARIFSQELFSSQTEYLAARRNTAASGINSVVVASGRTRLGVLGMTDAEIDAIERTGEARRLVTIFAPRGGVVVNRGVTAGTSVDPSTTLLTIADLSRVWVLAEVPEANIRGIRAGTSALLDFPSSGRAPFPARVDFVYPMLTERTRTLRVRLSAANRDGALRPGLYGMASFETTGDPVITIPREAVVDTGRQQHVFVAVGGRFEPRPVSLGVQLADRVEVRSGLQEGERIAAAGVFLLDSESRLRAAGGNGGGHNHGGGTPAGAPAADPDAGRKAEPAAPPGDPHAGHEMPAAPDPHAGH